jgi:hypothetical protein
MPDRKTRNPNSPQDDFAQWSAFTERSKSIDAYTDVLKEADKQSVTQVANFTKRIENVFQGTLTVYTIALGAVGIVFVISVLFVLIESTTNSQKSLGTFGIPFSLIIMLILVYRTPLKSARQITAEVIKMQVIYLGYIRQLNQIDMGFKQTFIKSEKLTAKQFQEIFTNTQQIIDNTLDDINLLLEELR